MELMMIMSKKISSGNLKFMQVFTFTAYNR